jgi:hypothetical protein
MLEIRRSFRRPVRCILERSLLPKKTLTVTFQKTLGDGHDFEPPRLMPAINRDDHFSLTEVVKKIPRKID